MNETSINIVPMAPSQYGVQIREGHTTTSHEVRVPPAFLDDLGLMEVDEMLVVEETFGFLLDKEPAAAIDQSFSLDDVAQTFPDFSDELSSRIALRG